MSAPAMHAARTESWATSNPRTITLLDLVAELFEGGANDSEVVEYVMDLVSRRRVALIGQVVAADLINH